MELSELFQTYLDRLKEARIYREQGLTEGAVEILQEISRELDASDLSEAEKESLHARIRSEREGLCEGPDAQPVFTELDSTDQLTETVDGRGAFDYAMVLMDGQFWEEAVKEFKRAALAGHRPMECWELCGDAVCHQEDWEEAIRYYEIVYLNPGVPESVRQQILTKITKCTQTLRKLDAKPSREIKQPPIVETAPQPSQSTRESGRPAPRQDVSPLSSLDKFSASELLGQQIHSWPMSDNEYLTGQQQSYRVLNLLHVGQSSAIFELEHMQTGERMAGQSLTQQFSSVASPQAISKWARMQLMIGSPYLARVHDVAHFSDQMFIVREYLPLTLSDLLSKEEIMPIPLAIYLAFQILEGLGDLHLLMGHDEQIRKIYHLDLRPSRILLFADKPLIRIYNGGLWKVIEQCGPEAVSLRKLPLPILSYRAPEQFRPYLSRKRPPAFTDIYLFGMLFYELLTGTPPVPCVILRRI